MKDFESQSNKIHVYECSDSDEGNISDEAGNADFQGVGVYVPQHTIDVRKDGIDDDQ